MSGPGRGGWPLPWGRASLQDKFALIAAGLLLVTSALFLVVVVHGYRARILAAHEQASTSVNLLLQSALENAMIKRDLDGLQEIVARLGAQQGIAGVMIVNPAGEVRFSSYPEMLFQPLSDPGFAQALESRSQAAGFRTLEGGAEVLRSINPVHNRAECLECHGLAAEHPVNGVLVVDYDSSGVRREVRDGAAVLGVLGVLVLAGLELGLWLALNRLVIGRLDSLRAATARAAKGELSVRAAVTGEDELARLGESFNAMAGQLEGAMGELRSSEAFLQALIDAVPDGVRVIDEAFRVVMVNRSYCDQLGTTRAAAVGNPCYASSHKRAVPCVPTMLECPVVRLIREGASQLKCSHVHVTDTGSKLPVEVIAAPVTMQMGARAVRCVVESIRDLETQLNISQEQRLSEMGMLAAGVAHEVHNPLSSIALALQAIRQETGASPAVRRYIGIAETEIANCQTITESLLRLVSSGQRAPELVEMGQVIRDTISLLSFEAERSGVRLSAEVEGHPRVLAGDSDMRTLVFNLMHNTIHAMPQGGVTVASVRVAGALVVLTVADTGIGISARDRDKILLPFWTKRGDGSQGRGLGLSIVKSIVDRLGGSVEIDSAPGQGARFVVSLPNADKPEAATDSEEGPA